MSMMTINQGPHISHVVPTQVSDQPFKRFIKVAHYGYKGSTARNYCSDRRPRVTYAQFMDCVVRQWDITVSPQDLALSCCFGTQLSLISSETEWVYAWEQHGEPTISSLIHVERDIGPLFTVIARPALPSDLLQKPPQTAINANQAVKEPGPVLSVAETKETKEQLHDVIGRCDDFSKISTAATQGPETTGNDPAAASIADIAFLKSTLQSLVVEVSQIREVLKDSLQDQRDNKASAATQTTFRAPAINAEPFATPTDDYSDRESAESGMSSTVMATEASSSPVWLEDIEEWPALPTGQVVWSDS